jgi:hypothetical protein
MGKTRHPVPHANAARNRVTEWQEWLNLVDCQVGELGFKSVNVYHEMAPSAPQKSGRHLLEILATRDQMC